MDEFPGGFDPCLFLVVGMGWWVVLDGAIFDQNTLAGVCVANHFAQNYLCQYVPAFSVLWRPFMVHEPLNTTQIIYIAYSLIVALYLAVPLLKVTVEQIVVPAGCATRWCIVFHPRAQASK